MRLVNSKSHRPPYRHRVCVADVRLHDYKKKYDYLNVEHQNLKGRYENLEGEKQELATIAWRRTSRRSTSCSGRSSELNKTPAQATGFEGMDVAFDAAAGTITVTLDNKILFDSGKATLKSTTSKELDQILSVVKAKYASKDIRRRGPHGHRPDSEVPLEGQPGAVGATCLVGDALPHRARHSRQAGACRRLRLGPAGRLQRYSGRQGQEPPRGDRRQRAQRNVRRPPLRS